MFEKMTSNMDQQLLQSTISSSFDDVTSTSIGGTELIVTTSEVPPQFNQLFLVKSIVLSLMFVVSLAGNTSIVTQLARRSGRKWTAFSRRRRPDDNIRFNVDTSSSTGHHHHQAMGPVGPPGSGLGTIELLIGNLAASDLFVTFFCNVTDAVWVSTIQWYAGNVGCKLVKYIQLFGLYLSTYIIVVIAIDRCSAVLDPMRERVTARRRVCFMIVGAWVLSAVFSLPQLFIFRVVRGPFREDFYQCVTHGAYTARWQEQLYSTLSVLLMYVLPLITMIVSYTLIFCTVAKKSRHFQLDDDHGSISKDQYKENHQRHPMLTQGGQVRIRLFRKAKNKSLRMTALIVAAFIICWTPYQVIFIIHTFSESIGGVDTRYVGWIFCFGMANSMVNPLIYGAFHLCSRRRRRQSNRHRRGSFEMSHSSSTLHMADSSRRPLTSSTLTSPPSYQHVTRLAPPSTKSMVNDVTSTRHVTVSGRSSSTGSSTSAMSVRCSTAAESRGARLNANMFYVDNDQLTQQQQQQLSPISDA